MGRAFRGMLMPLKVRKSPRTTDASRLSFRIAYTACYRPVPAGRREAFPWSSSPAILSPDPGKHVQGRRPYLFSCRRRRFRKRHATPGTREGAPYYAATNRRLRDYPRLTTSTPLTSRNGTGYSLSAGDFRTGNRPARVGFSPLTL